MKPTTRRLILGLRALEDLAAEGKQIELRTRRSRLRRRLANQFAKLQRSFDRKRIRQYIRLVGNPATGYFDYFRQTMEPG